MGVGPGREVGLGAAAEVVGVGAGGWVGLGAAGVWTGAGGLSCTSGTEGVAVGVDDSAGEGVEAAAAAIVGAGN